MGEPSKTWTGKNSDVFWPTDLLPKDLMKRKENVRILLYGYNAEVSDFGGKSSSDKIHHHAQTLVSSLYANRSVRHSRAWVSWSHD
jgi:protein SERAC1